MVHPRRRPEFRTAHARLGDLVPEVLLLAEEERFGRADLHASRLLPALVEEVGAAGALLRERELVVPVDGAVGAALHYLRPPGRLLGIDDDQPVIALVDGVGRCLDAGSVVAVLAERRLVGDAHAGHSPARRLLHADPEVPGLRLRPGDRAPVVVDVLVFAGDLAVVAAVAPGVVDHEHLHRLFALLLHSDVTRLPTFAVHSQ